MTPARCRIGLEGEIGVLHRALDPAVERHAEHVGQAEVVAAAARLRRRARSRTSRGGCRRAPRSRESRSHCASESAAASARISSLNRSRRSGVEERLVHQLERHARLDERVIHAEHVILGPVARRDAGVIGLGLLRVQQRDARERRLVAQVALVVEVPVVDALDDRQPAAVVEHAGELRDPRAHAVGGAFGHPEPDLGLALHRVLPAIRLFDADAEDAADRLAGPSPRGTPSPRRPLSHGGVRPRRAWLSVN